MSSDWIKLGIHRLETLVAISDQEHERGLQFEVWPPPIMSFYFKKSGIHSFWMKDTPSPLDIIFCHNDRIIDIIAGQPLSLRHVGPNRETNLVVEIPRGLSKKIGLEIGQSAKLQLSIKTTAKLFQNELFKTTQKRLQESLAK